MQIELNTYFDALASTPTATAAPSKAAFCKARRKLSILLFRDFSALLVKAFYQKAPIQTFKGYRLWACDGSAVKMPDNADTRTLGTHTNQHGTCASVKMLCYYDVLNHIITRFWLKNKRVQELRLVEAHIQDIPADVLAIYDRNYGSHLLVYLHHYYGSHCLIRLRVDFSKQVKQFLKSEKSQAIITENLNENAWRELRKMGLYKSKYHLITYRLIRVELPSGETEVLMSNLLSDAFTIEDFAELYRQRWGIETCFDYLKNSFKAPVFSGYSALVCQQDLWAIAIVFNLQTLLIKAAQPLLDKLCDRRKHAYQINRNVSLDSLKRNLSALFSTKSITALCNFLLQRFLKSLERIVKVVSRPRQRKRQRENERHMTEYNYKPAI